MCNENPRDFRIRYNYPNFEEKLMVTNYVPSKKYFVNLKDTQRQSSQVPLTEHQVNILENLLELRTATLSRFEIETDRIGQGVEKELAQLEKMGWVESEKIDNSLEPKVYFVSAKAFQLLRFPKKNQILSVSV
jgi:hypothetical protein